MMTNGRVVQALLGEDSMLIPWMKAFGEVSIFSVLPVLCFRSHNLITGHIVSVLFGCLPFYLWGPFSLMFSSKVSYPALQVIIPPLHNANLCCLSTASTTKIPEKSRRDKRVFHCGGLCLLKASRAEWDRMVSAMSYPRVGS